MAAIGFLLTFGAAIGGLYRYINSQIHEATKPGAEAVRDLAAHKLHVAETYVTKAGMQEQTSAIMKAIDAVGDKIDRTNERLDRVFEAPKTRRAS